MTKYLACLLALLGVVSIAAAEEPGLLGESDLLGHRFVLESVDGEKFAAPREVFIEFPAPGKISGRICNVFHGESELSGYTIRANVAMTRMLCPEPAMRKIEADFFRNLGMGFGFMRLGNTLELRRDFSVMVFRLADAGTPASGQGGMEGVTAGDLTGRKFVLSKSGGEDFSIQHGRQPFIEFGSDGRMGGSACNGFNGPYELKDGALFMRNAASTMMMCIDQTLSKYERDFHQLMRDGAKISLRGGELTLEGNGMTLLFIEEK